MKMKTSVTISEELLNQIDQFAPEGHNRSSFLEAAAWAYIARLRRAQQNLNDLVILNENAEHLNAETMDALEYQVA